MKKGIHPDYEPATIVCSCGNEIQTRSTQGEIHVEICSVCHPFYTGRQKLVDTAGRVERFQRKYGDVSARGSEDEDEPESEDVAPKAAAATEEAAEEGEEEAAEAAAEEESADASASAEETEAEEGTEAEEEKAEAEA